MADNSLGILLFTIFVFTQCNFLLSYAQTTQVAGGEQRAQGNVYGNDVLQREAPLLTGALKTWVDTSTRLIPGLLEEFYIYVHNCSYSEPGDSKSCEATSAKANTQIRLQIWREVDAELPLYQLRYEKIVSVDFTSDTGFLYMFSVAIDYFLTDQNDLIGWTYENYYGAISVSYNNAATSFFMKIKNSNYPTVGTTYTFDKIHLPAYFSIAVRIQGCPPWPSATTTTTYTTKTTTPTQTTTPMATTSTTSVTTTLASQSRTSTDPSSHTSQNPLSSSTITQPGSLPNGCSCDAYINTGVIIGLVAALCVCVVVILVGIGAGITLFIIHRRKQRGKNNSTAEPAVYFNIENNTSQQGYNPSPMADTQAQSAATSTPTQAHNLTNYETIPRPNNAADYYNISGDHDEGDDNSVYERPSNNTYVNDLGVTANVYQQMQNHN